MNFELNGRNISLAIIVAMGLCLEALKFWPSTQLATQVGSIEDRIFSTKPYAVSERSLHKTVTAPMPILHLPKAPNVAGFDFKSAVDKFNNEQKKVLEDQKKKEEAAKDWHWVYNKKLGQWVWKKKTEKKTEDKPTEIARYAPTIPTVPTAPTATDNTIQDPGVSALSSTPTPATTGYGSLGATGNKFLSQSEWEALLLKTANSTETKAFVQAYLNHLVTDTVFYAIVAEMLKDSRVDMEQQGVLALSLTPSADSFVQLATESTTAQSNSPLSSAVTTALQAYQQKANVDDLETVLKQQKTTSILTAALTQLESSITTNLNGTGSNPTTQGGSNLQLYQAFIPILTSLQSNSAVAQQAQQILGQISGTSNSAVAEIR